MQSDFAIYFPDALFLWKTQTPHSGSILAKQKQLLSY